jgi:hypothetical protein
MIFTRIAGHSWENWENCWTSKKTRAPVTNASNSKARVMASGRGTRRLSSQRHTG